MDACRQPPITASDLSPGAAQPTIHNTTMPQFTVNEQAILDDCVARRSDQFQRPAWMQSARATAIKLEARRRIAVLPPALPEERTTSRTHYEAARRVVAYDKHGNPYRFHEADVDGLPICVMRRWRYFTEGIERPEVVGPGPVTCGHCANTTGHA
jgi:hypothetical protein